MKSAASLLRQARTWLTTRSSRSWTWYRGRTRWQQIAIGVLLAVLIGGGLYLAGRGGTEATTAEARTVTLESVGTLSGTGSDTSIVGTVRSVTEADLLAQVGGTVRAVHTTLGASVPAGFVIADLDNASEAATVLQAEGAYEAAIASRNITSLQSGGTQTSFGEAQNTARTAYRSAYTALDTTLHNDVDTFFGENTPTGPRLLINRGPSSDLDRKRQALDARMAVWRKNLATANTQDPATLISQALTDTQAISDFLLELSRAANATDSGATAVQITALARARATVDAQTAELTAARDAYNAKKTAASVAGTPNSESGTQLAAANASVKTALGSLRGAQAQYEKTRIRATIGGAVNFLPIKTGQYVSAFEHVATVAQNGSLEIVAYVPEEQRDAISVGMKVQIEGSHQGIVTAISPALNPTTKQIEVHIAVNATPDLVNGQSVRISLPGEARAATATTTPATPSVLLLPLTAVKLLPDSRAVFTVGEDGRLVAHAVTIGDVVGDRIQVLSGLTPDMHIVTDVRGLSAGQKVSIAESSAS